MELGFLFHKGRRAMAGLTVEEKSLTLDGCKALGDEKAGLTRSKTRCAGRRQGAGRGEVD